MLFVGTVFPAASDQILLIVINAVNGIVDSLFTSNVLGVGAMSVIGLFAPMNHFLYALSMMLVSGSTLLYGKYIGKKPEAVQNVFSVDLLFSGIVSAVVSIVVILCATTGATSLFVKNAVQCRDFNQYLIGQAIGVPGLVLGQQLFAFLSLENQTRRTTAASLICLASNTVLDYVFLVVIPMGVFGLGFATAISEWLFFFVMAVYYMSGRSQLKFHVRNLNWHDVPQIIFRGYSGALSRAVEMFRCIVVNALIMKCVGDIGLSSFAATNSTMAIFWGLPFGMVAVARMLFSISMGEEDRRSLADTMRVVFRKGVPLMCAVAAAMALCAVPLTRLFYRDAADPVYHMTVMGFRLLPFCMPLAVISLNFACYAQSAEKKLLSIVLPIVDGFIGVSGLSLFMIPLFKMNGLYVANILNGVICFLVILYFSVREKKHMPENMEDLLAIPDDFGAKDDERLDITVRSMAEVETVSQQVIDFCTARGIDQRRANFSGLALEEMAGNVVEHGFKKDNKKHHSVDIRVVHKNDDILLRFRDDCAPFNPEERARLLEPADKLKNAGIRLVFAIAKDIQYQNLLGLNVLLIHM